jgi:hypothetical protein
VQYKPGDGMPIMVFVVPQYVGRVAFRSWLTGYWMADDARKNAM